MPTINDLRQQAATIKNATQVGENTATRVGTTFETIADLLEGMGGVTNLSTIDIGSIDTLNTTGDMLVGTPNIYTLTKTIGANTFKVGTLFQFANNGRYDVAQVIVSQFIVDTDGRIDTTSADQEVHIFYRLCKTMNGGSLPTPIGTWTTWTELGGSGGSGVTIDPYPTQNSGNAVSSGGVFERLQDVAPKVDISAIDDIDEYSDMLATKSPFYVVTKTLSGNVFRIGTLMEFANQGRYILYQILATDYVLNDDGTLDTTTSENGGLKLIWRMKQFSGNPPAGVTIGVWSAWSYLSGGGAQPDNEDIDLNADDQLQFANKAYDASAFSGLGRVYLRKNIVTSGGVDKNVLTQAMVNTANTIYHIQYDYDLNGQTITLPAGCVLEFDGGSVKNGTLNLVDTSIKADRVIFGDNLVITGKCLQVASPEWFAGTDADKIEKAIDVFSVVQLAARNYNISRTIVVNHSFALYGYGIPDYFGKNYAEENNEECSQTILFSSVGADNSVLRIDGPTRPYVSFVIEGVSFYGDGLSDAICINTAGGPSRPALITKCNIRNFNRGIYIAKRNTSTTNVGFIEISNNNITGNSYAIYSTGRSTIMHADINNNNLEQNTINHIYLSSETTGVTDAPLNGNLIIENNLLEGGSKYPVKVTSILSCIDFKNNYFEGSQSPYYVDINCGSNYGVLNVGSNHTANAIVIIKVNANVNVSPMAQGDNLEFAGNILSATNNLKLSVNSDANNKVHNVSAPYDSNVDKYPSEPLLKTTFDKQYQFNGFYAAKVENNAIVQQTLSGITLSAGYYTIACVVKYTGTQYYNAAGPAIDIHDMSNNVALFSGQVYFMYFKNIVIYTGQFYIEEETTGNLRIRVLGRNEVAPFFSDVFIYEGRFASVMLPHIDSAHCGTLPPILTSDDKGFVFYNKSIGKSITWNGEEWKDENGFTPARAKGTTAQRPTNLSPEDNGLQYYDTDLSKPLFMKSSVGTNLISQVVGGLTDTHINNTCASGVWYNLTATAHGGYRVQVSFRKAEGQTEDEITILYSTSATDNINFKAPDPAIYPYIYMKSNRPSGANVTFKINNINTGWVDATGTAV